MNPATRASLSGDEHSDYDSVLTEPLSLSDEEVMPELRLHPDAEDGAQGDQVRQSSGARLAMQVQTAAARTADGSGTNSPQLDPLRQLQVNQRQQQEVLAVPLPDPGLQEELERLRQEERRLEVQRVEQQHREQLAARQNEQQRLYHMQRIQMNTQRERQMVLEQEQEELERARRVDAGEEPQDRPDRPPQHYPCKACPARFSHHNLMMHHFREAHPVEKPFPCPDCGRGYVNRDVMEAHYLMVHRGERPYPCDLCEKVFSRPEYLQQHTRVHTGFKPYSCTYCPRRFAWRESFVYHTRTHTGEKPFLCVTCRREFRSKSILNLHEMIHTESFPFPCNQCERRFRRPSDLRNHVALQHQGEENDEEEEVARDVQVRDVTMEEQEAAIAAVLPLPQIEVQIL